jgi:PAS domain S-box-containing protein
MKLAPRRPWARAESVMWDSTATARQANPEPPAAAAPADADGRSGAAWSGAAEEHLAALVNQTIAGIAETDLTGRFIWVNDRYCQITGYTRAELLGGMTMQEITHADDLPRNLDQFRRLTAEGTAFGIEKRYLRKGGALVWVSNSVSLIRDADGTPRSVVAVVVDISERKRGEADARAGETRLRALAAATACAIWRVDAAGEVLDGEVDRWPFLTDLPPEALAAEWLAGVHPDDRAPGDAAWWAGVAAQRPFEFTQRVRQREGSYRHFLVRAVPIRDEVGAIREWVGADIDITAWKEAEAALRERDEFLRLTMQAARAGAWAVDVEADTDEWSEEVYPLLGLDPAGGASWARLLSVVHSDDRVWLEPKVNADIAAGQEAQSEFRVVWPDGSVHWIFARGRTILDAAGRPRRVGFFLDVTERKQAEIAIRRSEERFRSLVSVLTDVPWTADAAGAFVTFQPAWAAYTGQSWEEMRGFGWIDALHPDDRIAARESAARAAERQTFYESAGRLWHAPGGRYRYYATRAIPVRDADGRVREWVGACTDVHEQKQAEADRHTLLDALAHDLRNPLTTLKMQTQLLSRQLARPGGLAPDALASRIAHFEALADRMTGLLDELDDLARLTADDRDGDAFRRQPVDLAALVRDSVADARQAAGPRTIQLEMENGVITGAGDPSQLRRVIVNLLDNAVKYSPGGGPVQVDLRREGVSALLEVRDQGIGIPAEDLSRLFTIRHRASNVGAIPGSGVGLTVVKQIVERHGGTISVVSTEDQGSTFAVRLPLPGQKRDDG